MNLDRFNELLLESIGVGVALVRLPDLKVLFHNPRFAEWFPAVAEGDCGLRMLLPELDLDAVARAHEAGKPFTAESSIRIRRRPIVLAIQITRHERDGECLLMLECQNISKIKDMEYMIESYSQMVEKNTRELKKEKERAEKLLLNIMPRTIYEELKTFGVSAPQKYESASVLMLDFVGFTQMAISHDPAALIAELNDIFTAFDRISDQFGCERIKTIGDAYMAVCGLPEPSPDHAQSIAQVALLFVRYLERRNRSREQQWLCRIGINSGPVIGSIVGVQKYVYDIFGPGVNLAARLEAFSGPMQITLCEDMYPLVRARFTCTERETVEVRGFGKKRLYSLDGSDDYEIGAALP